MLDLVRRQLNLDAAIFFFSAALFGWLIWYFYTGYGGPQELASRLISLVLILQILFMYREDYFYKWLPPRINDAIIVLYVGICLYALWYFWIEFEQVAIYRQGSYTTQDYIVGLLIFLLVMELSRRVHPVLFWINLFLVFYTL